jgi:hypothetical protein
MTPDQSLTNEMPMEVLTGLLDKDKLISHTINSYLENKPINNTVITPPMLAKHFQYVNIDKPDLSITEKIDPSLDKPLRLDIGSISLRAVKQDGKVYWIFHFAPGGAKTKADAMEIYKNSFQILRILMNDLSDCLEYLQSQNIPLPDKVIAGETNNDMLAVIERLADEVKEYKSMIGFSGKIPTWKFENFKFILEKFKKRAENSKK